MPDKTVEVKIRDAIPADLDFLRDGLRKLDEEMRELGRATGIYRQGLQGLDVEGCLQREAFLVAANDHERRGFLSIYYPNPTTGALAPSRQPASINTVYVLPEFRRQGVASMLLEAAEAKCRAWGATGIGLGFIEGNHAAEAAYRKAGYVTTRRAMWRSLD